MLGMSGNRSCSVQINTVEEGEVERSVFDSDILFVACGLTVDPMHGEPQQDGRQGGSVDEPESPSK